MDKNNSCSKFFRKNFRRLRSWWKDGPMNPLFLNIYDKKLQEEFQLKQRKIVNYRLKVAVIILWIYLALVVASKAKEIEKHFFFLTIFGSCTVIATIVSLTARCKISAIDYTSLA